MRNNLVVYHHKYMYSRLPKLFVASPLSTQPYGVRAKTVWLGIRIMCLSGATCLSVDCCFSELAL